MGATELQQAACRECGAGLAHDNDTGLCWAHRHAEEPETRIMDAERLVDVVAGLLLIWRGLKPGRQCHLRRELARLGVDADHLDIFAAVMKLRRRYSWQVDAEERRPGYRLDAWPYRWRRQRSPQMRLFRVR